MFVLTAGCGMGDDMAAPSSPSSTAAGETNSSAAGADAGRSAVPDVVVRDVATGADVNVRTAAARPDRPTLYWFWAPH
jgi:hypothetical protein